MRKIVIILLLVLLIAAVAYAADAQIQLKANQSVTVQCLEYDKIIVHPGQDSVQITCRVWLDDKEGAR